MSENYYLDNIQDIIEQRLEIFNNTNSITVKNNLPSDGNYPLKNNHWYKIPDVICVYVDMKNSTKLSASTHDKSTASIYELFTGTAIRIFHEFKASYIDVKGDGVFALFNKDEVFRSFASAISFRTFCEKSFMPILNDKIKQLGIGYHMGIDQKTVLVKQIGLKDDDSRDSRKNEVWAGKTINMAAKLASLSIDNELYISNRYYKNLNDEKLVTLTCGCVDEIPSDNKVQLWKKYPLNDDKFDFESAYLLNTYWCKTHGKEWCTEILKLDEKKN